MNEKYPNTSGKMYVIKLNRWLRKSSLVQRTTFGVTSVIRAGLQSSGTTGRLGIWIPVKDVGMFVGGEMFVDASGEVSVGFTIITEALQPAHGNL